jgi:DNA topoisomerase-1
MGTRVTSIAPAQAARAASLRYVSDGAPGLIRRRKGSGFTYATADGRVVRDGETVTRIRSLAIPPAWTDVWICAIPHGHLQATGRDARGRKQYRYHPKWRQVRDENKYAKLSAFARALPKIRRRVKADLELPGLPRSKVLAIIVRLLETTFIRVGNEEYARTNGSFGLTTMQDRHVRVEGSSVQLRFRGKSGKTHAVEIGDKRLAQLVRRCREVPGQHLFQYIDDDGQPQPVDSGDVNDYLREITGDDFTAKDFRTWGGTLLAAALVSEAPANAKHGKSALIAAVESVSKVLGNTVAICRKCYVHPAVLDAFVSAETFKRWKVARTRPAAVRTLAANERALLRFLVLYEKGTKAA